MHWLKRTPTGAALGKTHVIRIVDAHLAASGDFAVFKTVVTIHPQYSILSTQRPSIHEKLP